MPMIAAAVLCLWASSPGAHSTPATQLDGLTATLQADPVTVPMGEAVRFVVTLAFDTTIAATDTRILNKLSSRCEFILVNKKTGTSFARSPYDSGMPRMQQPGNLEQLAHGDRLELEDMTVHLLSEKGEQIPPGEYSVRAIYENDGGGKVEAYLDSTHHYRFRVYDGRWKLWTGKIESQPCAITIGPASEATVEVDVPKTLVVYSSTGQIGWTYKATSQIRVNKRPGFALGNRWHLETRVDGIMVSEFPRGEGLHSSGMSFLSRDVSLECRPGRMRSSSFTWRYLKPRSSQGTVGCRSKVISRFYGVVRRGTNSPVTVSRAAPTPENSTAHASLPSKSLCLFADDRSDSGVHLGEDGACLRARKQEAAQRNLHHYNAR